MARILSVKVSEEWGASSSWQFEGDADAVEHGLRRPVRNDTDVTGAERLRILRRCPCGALHMAVPWQFHCARCVPRAVDEFSERRTKEYNRRRKMLARERRAIERRARQ